MFCPKCATQNLDGASFCRSCGANISLVSQALAGQVPRQTSTEMETTGDSCNPRKPLTLEQSFKNIFMGFAFLIIAIVLSRTIGQWWWFWFLIPSFSMMGIGIAQFIRIRNQERQSLMAPPPIRAFHDQANQERLMPPTPSVTEGTTRHLNVRERQ